MGTIELRLKKHDEFQLELKFTCPILEKEATSNYYADMFFFLPRNLAVNPQTYSAEKFYNALSEYIRFQTPSVKLSDLGKSDNHLLTNISNSFDNSIENMANYQQNLKMFCSIVRKSFKYESQEIIKKISVNCCDGKDIEDYLSKSSEVLINFRQLKSQAPKNSYKLELLLLVDEFLSVTLNDCLYKIFCQIEKSNSSFDTEKISIIKQTYSEIEYRKECNHLSIPNEKSDNSELLYRESTLKKAMASVLFLNIALKKDGIWIENIFLGLAAAVAMIFVTAIAFIWKGLFLEEFSISFFVVWVIAYIFKDRIKSQLQTLCINKRNRYAYDYQQKIYDGLGNEVGFCREGFQHYLAKDLPKTIENIRNRTALSKLENGSLNENILVYRKKIEIKGDNCKNNFKEFKINGIVDILRLNVRHWLDKMDNPTKIIYSSNGEKIKPIKAHRHYHVNIVLRYGKKGGIVQYCRYRIILSRNGIKKIIRFEN